MNYENKEITVDTSKAYWILMRPTYRVPFIPGFTWTNESEEPNWTPCIISNVSFKLGVVRVTLRILGTTLEKEYKLEDFQDLLKSGRAVEDKGYHLEEIVINDYLAPGISIRTAGWILSD